MIFQSMDGGTIITPRRFRFAFEHLSHSVRFEHKDFEDEQSAIAFQNSLGAAGAGSVVVPTGDGGYSVHWGSSYQQADLQETNTGLAEESMGFNEDIAAANLEIAAAQVEIAQAQQAMSEEQYNYWKTTFQPLEKDVAEGARVGIDPAQAAARAGSDVTATFAKSKEQAARDQARMGIDPSSGRLQEQQKSLEIAQAAAEAGARTQARNVTSDVNYQRMLNAVSIGRNLPSTAASISGQSAATYGAAAGTQRGAADTYQQGVNTAIGVNNTGIQSAQYQQSLDQQAKASSQAATAGAVSSVAGLTTVKYIANCIPFGGMVDTPNGPREISTIKAGDMVIGYDGRPVKVEQKHEYVEYNDKNFRTLVFEDGTQIRACTNHKINQRPLSDYAVGDVIGGKKVINILTLTAVSRSYDLLTLARFGGYQMAGVPVNSMIPDLIERAAKYYADKGGI